RSTPPAPAGVRGLRDGYHSLHVVPFFGDVLPPALPPRSTADSEGVSPPYATIARFEYFRERLAFTRSAFVRGRKSHVLGGYHRHQFVLAGCLCCQAGGCKLAVLRLARPASTIDLREPGEAPSPSSYLSHRRCPPRTRCGRSFPRGDLDGRHDRRPVPVRLDGGRARDAATGRVPSGDVHPAGGGHLCRAKPKPGGLGARRRHAVSSALVAGRRPAPD